MCGPLSGPCVSLSLQCRKEAGVADFLPRSQSSNENSEFLRVLSPCPIYGADGARDIAISLLSPPPPPVASALRSLSAWLTFCQLFILHQQSLLFLKDPPEASSTPFLARARFFVAGILEKSFTSRLNFPSENSWESGSP